MLVSRDHAKKQHSAVGERIVISISQLNTGDAVAYKMDNTNSDKHFGGTYKEEYKFSR